eukprot:8112664-Alexandrium_andersonii.AAC.1
MHVWCHGMQRSFGALATRCGWNQEGSGQRRTAAFIRKPLWLSTAMSQVPLLHHMASARWALLAP